MNPIWWAVTDPRSFKAVLKLVFGKELPESLKVPGALWVRLRQISGMAISFERHPDLEGGSLILGFRFEGIFFY